VAPGGEGVGPELPEPIPVGLCSSVPEAGLLAVAAALAPPLLVPLLLPLSEPPALPVPDIVAPALLVAVPRLLVPGSG
jgi:hypothetical protein